MKIKLPISIFLTIVFAFKILAQNSINGYKHTPQGDLHILIVFAEKTGDNFTMDDWPLGEIPDWANEMFETDVENIGDNNNLSKYYYELSKFTAKPFLVTAFVYPELVSVNDKLNFKVFDAIETADPDFPWGDFDNRNNRSFWTTDNSISLPDDTIDYAVIIWRDNSQADGGEATNNGTVQTNDTPPVTYTIADGHKHYYTSGSFMSNLPLFTHEFGHEIWRSPHYCAANNVTGENYYTYYGWGMMGHSNGPFKAANAWEMWWLGWLPGVTTIETDVANNGTYYLKDLYTENEAIRIEIPYSGGQYVWIENHQLADAYLDYRWEKVGTIYIPELNQGLYMYITKLGNDQNNIDLIPGTGHNDKANHIKVLHGDGNFDYSYITEMSLEGWGTQALFLRGDTNVIAGENDFTSLRGDYNLTGGTDLIYVNENWNGGTGGEIKSIGLEWIGGVAEETYNFLGTPGAEFSLDDELSLSGIIPVLNYPSHDLSSNALEPFYLNGLQIEITDYNTTTGEYTIDVAFNDWEVRENKRWCGNINLPADENLVIQNDVELTFNKSGVSDRSVKDPTHDFINPTKFTIESGSSVTLKSNASLVVDDYTELIIENGAELIIETNAVFQAINNGKIILQSGTTIKATHSGAKILIEEDGVLVMEGNDIQLNNSSAKIELKGGGTIETADNVDFTFTGTGHLVYYADGIFDLGNNSRFYLKGTGKTDLKCYLHEDADLYISTRDVWLEDCKISYYNGSRMRNAYANYYSENVMYNTGGTSAIHGISAYDTETFYITQATFDGFQTPITLESIDVCPDDVNVEIRQTTIKNYSTQGIFALDVDRMYLYANIIEGNANATTGMWLENVVECNVEAGTIKNHTNQPGVMLYNTRYFILDGATIKSNNRGIESYRSNIYLRNQATIKQNTIEGIYAFSAINDTEDPDILCKIVVGDIGCGWIIQNGTGILGRDILLDIDAVLHAIKEGDVEQPNRFDGNTQAIQVCYDYFDGTYISNTLMAKGNYWTGSAAPSVSDVSTGFNANCNDISTDASLYVTTQPNNCDCPANCTDTEDEEALTLRMTNNSCGYYINEQGGGRISIAEKYQEAYQLFLANDFNYAYQKFNWIKNRVEAEYPQGLPDGICKDLYARAYWYKDQMAEIAEVHCQ